MTKKRMGVLLILLLVMIISVGAISAADTNDTLLEEASDTNIATASVALEDNAASPQSDAGSDVEINESDNSDEISDEKVKGDASSNVGEEVLSASNDDLLGENPNFYYNGKWYGDLDDAVDDACDNNGGTIYLKARAWGYDSAEREITISKGVWITFQPYNSGDEVIFDGQGDHEHWLFKINDKNAHVTFNSITFRNGGAFQGGAIEVVHGSLTLNNCKLENNKAYQNLGGGFGWGGAIFLDESDASLVANNCRFTNNNAASGGGAVYLEDGSSATFNDCYFEGNKAAGSANHVQDEDSSCSHSFNNCRFIGSGSIEIEVHAPYKSVDITPDVNDDVNYAVLYKDGSYYDRKACNDGDTATFSNLERGTYTVYMMKNWECRYEYSGTTFTIIEPYFVLNDEKVFETLSGAINAISSGGSGVITVEGGTYTGSSNFNVQIVNKRVTIRPKDTDDPVTFSSNSQKYLFDVGSNSQLTMEDITVTGKFSDIALKFLTNQECTISDCEFKNIKNTQNQPERPIFAQNSNLVLSGNNFESSSRIVFGNTVVKIDDCTFTSNHGINGGAIYADTHSDVTITNSEFTANEGTGSGGAIYANKLNIHDTTFIGNSANMGGAVYIASGSSNLVNITGCVFDSNAATTGYRNIYSESLTRKFFLQFNEYDLNLQLIAKDGAYGMEYVLEGVFDWGSNLDNNYTLLAGVMDETVFGGLLTIEDNQFKINVGVLSGGTHEFTMTGMHTQGDSNDHFYGHEYYSDLLGNEFYLNKEAYAKILIEKARITLNLAVNSVLIPETPVLNVRANWDNNYTIIIGNKNYQLEVVNGKASMPLTDLDLGNYTVVGMRDGDENYYFVMNFTTFSVSKTYSNFLVVSTNVEYDTLGEAVANSNSEDMIYIKNGTYKETGVIISGKVLAIIALDGAIFDAQGRDANFITVNENAIADISGITFRGLHNRNTNYGAIVNHGYLALTSCNFTDNKITKTSFAENGGAAIFSDGQSLDIDSCNFINNAAPLKVSTAAVTSLGHDDVSITDSKFINNSAREGGAVHFKNLIQFEDAITSCDFEKNTAVKGSAIYVGNNSVYVSVTLSDFKKNDLKNSLGENAQLEGGVIYVNANAGDAIMDISLSNFEDNSNSKVDGGVLCLDGSSRASIAGCTFNNNSGKLGSVILIKNPYNKKLTLMMDSSAFTNNNAATGAIATSPKVTALIDECVFANNTGENRHIYSNGFTVVHDSIFDVKDAKLNAPSVQHGESSIITGTADIGTNIYAAANLTVAGENNLIEIKNNAFTYDAGKLDHGKYYAVLNSISDNNNNTYLMDGITEVFRVYNSGFDLNVSVDNITYGETLKVVETLPSTATGAVGYQLNGNYYTKEEIESLKLDAGKYTLVAFYDHDDFAFTSTTVDFEVYKANPIISVPDVEVEYNDSIVLNIESDVPSIYTIEIEDYKNAVFVNGSRTIVIDKTLNPGNYTIKVTSQERVNYISNSTEAILNVNGNLPVFSLRISSTNMEDMGTDNVDEIDSLVDVSNNGQPLMKFSSIRYFAIDDTKSDENIGNSPDNDLGDEYDDYKFIYQYDEDSDPEYYETLEDAIDEAVTWGAGIITVRGGTYSGYGFYGIDIEGEVELTIRAYEDEEVIFDCGGENYFMVLTYDTEMEWVQVPPPPHPEFEQTDGPTVTLENITVINGFATYGGAIDLEVGTLTLMNCNFRNNNADEGGAIYIGKWDAENDATLIALNTTFTNNYATSKGGAIYIASDNLDGQTTSASLYACTFLDNYQGEDEDRVRNYFAGGNVEEITCQYCVFNGNGTIYSVVIDKINQTVYVNGTSNDVFDSVVLLYFDQTPLYTINNNGSRDFSVTFEDVMGGNYTLGVMNDHNFNTYIFENKFEMKVPNFIISEDEVYENLTDAIDAVAENGIIYANMNYYTEDNMEIDIRKSFTLKNFRDRDVVFDGSSEKWFFTIAEGCTVAFEGIYFTEGAVKNHASIENYGTLVINNCSFESFETAEIIYNSGLLNILNSTFSLNSVNDALVWNDKDLFIDTVEFSYNIVNTSSAVYTNGAADIVASNFTGNYNFGNGGAIYNAKSLSVKDTVFSENEGMDGGAVYNAGTLQVLNCTFEDNSANGYGGAIYNWNEANIFNSTFTGSSSEKDGGAIYNNNEMTMVNSTFVGNTATGKGGAIYSNQALVLTKSLFGINFAEEYANIYNAGDIQFSENIFDFYDVILIVPDGQYGIPTTITGTLNPEFNMDLQITLPGFVNGKDAPVTISDGVFEYVADILPKGVYDVVLNEIIYDGYGNIYYGESITDRLVINKANVYINVTVDDVVIRGESGSPVLKIDTSKTGSFHVLFNNRLFDVNITDEHSSITLDAVGEGNYSVTVVREGDENYNDAANTTAFKVSKYEGKFIVNSTGNEFETLREALADSSNDDVIYVREGTYSGADNLGLTISGKKLSIISLGDVVFDGNSSGLSFLTVDGNADVTLCDVVITGFNKINTNGLIVNRGDLTFDGVTIFNNTIFADDSKSIIYNRGNLNIVGSGFYDNKLSHVSLIHSPSTTSTTIVNESRFENNTLDMGSIILINYNIIVQYKENSVKIISNVFAENRIKSGSWPSNIIAVYSSKDILISSEFYNNTLDGDVIHAFDSINLTVNNSIFTGNKASQIIYSDEDQITISESLFTDNTVKNAVLIKDDKNLHVLESTFSDNTLSDKGALNIASGVNAIVNGSVFTNNKADKYRNIYSEGTVDISNSVFDALNVDFTVHDIDYGQTETIEGTIDIGTNLNLPVNLDINSKTYSVNVTNNRFTYNAGILNAGDYAVALNEKDPNSNTYVFDKITKIFTVSRVDPGLSISIADITQGEKLKVNTTISKNASANVVYELDGKIYSKKELENLTLAPGDYLVVAMYRGDKNFLSAAAMDNVKVHKVAPNITVSDVVINYGDEIKVNVSADVADYYTVFIGNESVSLYVNDDATFTFASENFKSGNYEITVYVFETDDYDEAYAYATLTVNKAVGIFNLTNDTIVQGENATISIEVPLNAYGNITYNVYDADGKSVYSITQSCLNELIVPNLNPGLYNVTGIYEGDSYYTNESIINAGEIFVRALVDVIITVDDITYGENATVTVESTVDGEYLVYVGTEPVIVTVINGIGNVSVPNLSAGSHVANVTIVDGNYSAFNETVFDVAPKSVSVSIFVEDILYGEDAIVNVYGEIDGEYIVEIDNQNYTVNVADGKGSTAVYNLAVSKDILASVTIANSNYSAHNTTTFTVISKYDTPISLDVMTGENNVTMTVTVNDTATGLVKFQVKGIEERSLYVDVINGKAVLEGIFAIGDYTVIATYMGDSRFNTNITYDDFTVRGHIKKNTTITAYADVIVDKVTITVSVDENATGFVKLTVGDTVANIELVGGVANVTTIMPANSYFVDVTYLGDENYNINNTHVTFTVTEISKENTTIDLNITVDENTAMFDVDLNETVTGLVKFYIISKETGENYTIYMDVKEGHVKAFTDSIAAGNYTLIATYMGDSVFNTNTTSKDFEVIGHVMKDTPIDATVETNLNKVTLTVKVDENATGFVEVRYGDGVFNIALENGEATFTTEVPYGSYSLNITYLGDENYNKNSTKREFTIVEPAKATTPISLDVVTGENNVAMTVTVNDTATGLVKFQVMGSAGEYTLYADVINGKAVLEDVLPTGDYTVFATYMGDGRFNTNITYGDFTLMGHIKKDTPITAYADVNGNRVTLTVNVDENATGFVKLSVGDGLDANVELVNGVATLTTTLPANSYFVDVAYLGDDNYNENKTKLTFTITEISKFKTAIDLNISVDENSAMFDVGLNKTATGLVKFYIISKESGENYTMYRDVEDGYVGLFINGIEPGNYSVTATYMGDSAFNTNIITKDFEVIGHVMKDTHIDATVETNLNKVTLTVKVDENATGFVEVKFGDGVFNIALENGEATFTTEVPYGSYSLDITYLGDENYNKNSTKREFTIVEPAKATTPISLDVVTGENNVAMTVTVDDAAIGLVKFQVKGSAGEYTLYADVINGKAVLEDVLPTGDYTVIATYMGDSRFNTNITYGDFTLMGHIKKDTPITAYADVNGNRVTLTVNVDENATGFVKLSVGDTEANIELVNGVATLTTTLPANSYFVDVTYLGDDNYNVNNTKLTFTITEVSKENTVIDLNITVDENNAKFDVGLNKSATGLVKFYIINKESGKNATLYMDVKDGHAGIVNDFDSGNYTVVATYMGDSVFNTNATSKDFEVIGHVMKDTPIDATVETNLNKVTLAVKVDENATGFVEVKFGDGVFNIALENGEATFTTEVPYGSYSLDITYLGDENYNKNSTKREFTIVEPAKDNTPISLDVVAGENDVTMTVTVDDAATGLVKFKVTGEKEYVVYSDVIGGKAVLEDVLATGDYTVIATYMGDSRFNTNITYGDFTLRGHIKKDTPITAYADVIGNRVTLTVSVDENATGFVKLSVGDGLDANVELVNGVATLTTTLPANSYFVDVTYLGDDNYNVNNTKLTFTVTEISKENTAIDLNITVDENSAVFVVGLNKTATGLVKFYIISKKSGENTTLYMDVKDGHAGIVNDFDSGNYTVVATYMGDSVFNTNTTFEDFEVIGHVMKDTPIDATVETNLNKVTLTVKVDENATGFVEIKYGDTSFNLALENGEATFTTELPYGSYSLDITYLGDENYNKNSTKSEFTIVEPAKENTPISLDVVTGENDVTMTVTVDDAATGLVKFQVMGSAGEYILYADVINGKAVLEDVLPTGDYTVFATYMGDNRFNTNITYGDFTIRGHIKKDTPITAYADVVGNRVTLTVKVDKNATGFVKLSVGDTGANIELADGVATLTLTLPANSYFVDVAYLGDDNYNVNNTKLTFTVTDVSKENTAIDLNISVDESDAVFVVGLNKSATGFVKFYIFSKESDKNATLYMDVKDGYAGILIKDFDSRNYTVVATYMGDSVFNTNATSKDFEVIGHVMKDTPIDAIVETNLNKVTLTVKVDENATGFVEVKFGDGVFNIALKNGEASFTTELPYGSYSLNITYLGDENYNKNSTKSEFTIVEPAKENTPISLDVVTGENDVAMTVTVDDAATGLVKFQVMGSAGEYTLYADVINGKAVLEDVLPTGDYTVIATYMGDSRFNTNITYGDFTIRGHIKKDTPIAAYADVNGNRVTLTVKVDENATGFVKLSVGDTEANIELADGVATLTLTLPANSYFVDVTYLGDDNYNVNNTKLTFTVTDVSKENTAIDLNIITVDEDSVVFVVDLNKSATGLVKFYIISKESGKNATSYMDVKNGYARIIVHDFDSGNYTVVATYMGDSVFNTNATSKDFEVIGHVMKDTPIDATVETNLNKVTLTVKVDENATGFVEVKFGDNLFNIALKNGEATFTTELPYGNYSLDITYLGDENYNKNSTKREFTIAEKQKVNISVDVPDHVEPGDEAKVNITLPDDATGNVVVLVDGKEVGAMIVSGGNISLPVGELAAGDHVVEVRYSGDDKYAASSETKAVNVAKLNSTISATSAEITEGETAVITVNVDADATGRVLIDVGGNKFYADVVDGIAKVNLVGLTAGNYVADVVYLGDDKYGEATGSADITVNAKPEPATSDVNITVPVDYKVGEMSNVTVDIPGASGNVSVIVDGVETVVELDEKGTAVVPMNMTPGEHSVVVVYTGDETHAPAVKTTSINVALLTSQFKNITLSGDLVLTGVLVNSMGDVIPDATITYATGTKKGTLTTAADGSFTIKAENNAVLSIAYAGTSDVLGTSIDIEIDIQEITPERLGSKFNVTEGISIKTYAVDSPAGEIGQTNLFLLTDSNGNPIANASVQFAYKTVILNRSTDENGIVFIGINTQVAQEALCAMSYLGDEKYNATFVAFSYDIQKKPFKISASAKTYKASAKTKKYTVTIKTEKCNSRDGKVYLSAGKKITMKINGKTYTAKTNAKGQATFSLKITKRGKFAASIKFAGDKTYASASKSVKITIK